MATATHEKPATDTKPEDKQKKEDERRAKIKAAVRAANDELHAIRPQPRADQIEAILDQIRNSPDEPPADEKAAKAKAKELFEKANPKDEKPEKAA